MTITGKFNTKQKFNARLLTDKQLEDYLLRVRGLYVMVG